jgi:hypothetical protein
VRGFGTKLIHAAAIVGLLSGLAAAPAFADRHKHWKKHHRGDHRSHYYRDYDRPRRGYYRDYDRSYYYSGPRAYYGPPGVYVHPAPPSFGLSLVFPIH